MKTTLISLKKSILALLLTITATQLSVKGQSAAASSSIEAQSIYSNAALGKTAVSTSSDDASRTANYAIDGNQATRFASGYSDNQSLSVDLGKAYLISEVMITWEKSYGKDFNILFSNNGTYTDLYTDSIQVRNHILSGNSVAGTDTLHMKSNTIARYMRMQGIKAATGKGYSIWEMQVMGATAVTSLFPVSVSGFAVTAQSSQGLLEWTTITEYSNAGFTIERSNDGVTFTGIGWIAARNTGTVTSHYSFIDKQPFSGKNYYRLKQTWVDGKLGYSPVITINLAGSTSVNVYPVPVKNNLTVEYRGDAGENISIAIYNTSGFPVYNNKFSVQTGQQTLVINRTANMTAGQYYLSVVSSSNKKYTEKIILQ